MNTNDESEPKDTVAWFDATLEADHWAAMDDIEPVHAAMLMCQFNPNAETEKSAALVTSDELSPEHFVRLVQRLKDIGTQKPARRTLRDWHRIAKSDGLKYHSWIDAYMDATVQPEPEEDIEYAMLAGSSDLIAAFGPTTGMNKQWFSSLKDTPALLAARRVRGVGGKKFTEPLFCPFEVMSWLINPKRRKGRPLDDKQGWSLLKSHFPRVYERYSIGEPDWPG